MTAPRRERDLDLAARAILSKIVDSAPQDRDSLRCQVSHTRVAGGPITMLALEAATGPRLNLPDGPLPLRAEVRAQTGQPIGEIIVWISDGRLSALEFAWWTDQPPTQLPPQAHVHLC